MAIECMSKELALAPILHGGSSVTFSISIAVRKTFSSDT